MEDGLGSVSYRTVRYSLNSELEATPQPCGNGDPFRPSAGGDVSSLFSDTAGATPNLSIEPQGRMLHWNQTTDVMHMWLCGKYDALKAACKVVLSIRIGSMIPTLACFKTNAGGF